MKDFQPLVSVIINCFNGEKYLREAIDSVMNQTYTNWELIFWDNQSTDYTAEIVKSYKDDRIRYFYAPQHTPLGEARNLAVKEAKGEYINFLDADDVWMPEKLAEQIKLIVPGECEVVYTPFELFIIDEENKNKAMLKMFNSIKNYRPKEKNMYKELLEQNRIVFSTVIFNKELYNKVGGINPRFKQNEDYDILLKCALQTNFACTKETRAKYRIHGNNNSNEIWNLGYFENRVIFNLLPESSYVKDAIVKNETRIATYMIINNRQYFDGFKLLCTKGSIFQLIILFLKKIYRYAFAI